MVLISMWLTLLVNKYFAVIQCVHAWQIKNLAETNFVEIFGRAKQILSVQCVPTLCQWCVGRFVRFGQNLSSRDKPSALEARWWWQKIPLNKQLFCYLQLISWLLSLCHPLNENHKLGKPAVTLRTPVECLVGAKGFLSQRSPLLFCAVTKPAGRGVYSLIWAIWRRGNTFFDVTVTGQWSSPSGCVVLRSISSLRSVFCFLLRLKISLILLVIGEFDVLKWVFNTQAMFVKNSGTGESFCVE